MVGILVASFYSVQADNIIVPGIRVGDFTFDMTKDDLLKKLGRPSSIFYGGKDYTLEDLPEAYYMGFDDITFLIRDGSVRGIGVGSQLYKFTNGLGVGSSEQRVVETFGEDFHLKDGKSKDFLTYQDEGLEFEISRTRRTVLEMSIQTSQREQSDNIIVTGLRSAVFRTLADLSGSVATGGPDCNPNARCTARSAGTASSRATKAEILISLVVII